MAAAAPEASRSGSPPVAERRMRMMCSHGGCFAPCRPDGAVRYVGGETRVLAVPRGVSFRELSTRLGEKLAGGGKIVTALRYRLADDEEVLVSVTCDEELAHMRDEYDRLQATRPSATFRVFFSGVQMRPQASGRPPLHPGTLRRVQSDPCTAARVAGPAPAPSPMRRVQSAQHLAHFRPCCYDDKPRRRPDHDQYLTPMRPPLSTTSKNSHGAIREGQDLLSAKAAAGKARSRSVYANCREEPAMAWQRRTGVLSGSWSEVRV